MAQRDVMGIETHIAIVGGGASGLAAAFAAARTGAKVAILEKLPRVGKKILATGNGRCNLGNAFGGLSRYHGTVDVSALSSALFREAEFFQSMGLWLSPPDKEGRLYPHSEQASAVLDALRMACKTHGVQEVTAFHVQDIERLSEGFLVKAKTGARITAKGVILATGGLAGPKFGSTGDGHALARKLGHSVTDCYPALAPIPVEAKLVRPLKGLRVLAEVTAYQTGKQVGKTRGQVQFTDVALSGICVFDLAAYRPDTLALNLLPWCEDPFALVLQIAALRHDAPLEDMLTGLFPKRIGQMLIKDCTDLSLSSPVSALGRGNLEDLARLMTDWRFPAFPAQNWDTAQATAGGVTGIKATLESPRIPGLYFAGEILDVHGDCGGYNLAWAWASGTVAGENAARGLGL